MGLFMIGQLKMVGLTLGKPERGAGAPGLVTAGPGATLNLKDTGGSGSPAWRNGLEDRKWIFTKSIWT